MIIKKGPDLLIRKELNKDLKLNIINPNEWLKLHSQVLNNIKKDEPIKSNTFSILENDNNNDDDDDDDDDNNKN